MTNQLNVESALAAVMPSLRAQHRAAPPGDHVALVRTGPEGEPVVELMPRVKAGWLVRGHRFGMASSVHLLSELPRRGRIPTVVMGPDAVSVVFSVDPREEAK